MEVNWIGIILFWLGGFVTGAGAMGVIQVWLHRRVKRKAVERFKRAASFGSPVSFSARFKGFMSGIDK